MSQVMSVDRESESRSNDLFVWMPFADLDMNMYPDDLFKEIFSEIAAMSDRYG